VDPILVKDVLNCTTTVLGVQFVITVGTLMKLMLCAESWASLGLLLSMKTLLLDMELAQSGGFKTAALDMRIICLAAQSKLESGPVVPMKMMQE
jgi:hypothetical protein